MSKLAKKCLAAILAGIVAGCLSVSWAASGSQSSVQSPRMGQIERILGKATILRPGARSAQTAGAGDSVLVRNRLETLSGSMAWWSLRSSYLDQSDASLGQNSQLEFSGYAQNEESSDVWLGIPTGIVRLMKVLPRTSSESTFMATTSTTLVWVDAPERAADFVVESLSPEMTVITVIRGTVRVKNISESLNTIRTLQACQTVTIEQDTEPSKVRRVSSGILRSLIERTTIPGSLPITIPSCSMAVVPEEPIPSISMAEIPAPLQPGDQGTDGLGFPGAGGAGGGGAGAGSGGFGGGGAGGGGDGFGNLPLDGGVNPPPGGGGNLPPGGSGKETEPEKKPKVEKMDDSKQQLKDWVKKQPSDFGLAGSGGNNPPGVGGGNGNGDITGKLQEALTSTPKVDGTIDKSKVWVFDPQNCVRLPDGSYKCGTVIVGGTGNLKPNQRLVCSVDNLGQISKCWKQECPECESWGPYQTSDGIMKCLPPPMQKDECLNLGGNWTNCQCELQPRSACGCGKAVVQGMGKELKCLPPEPCPDGHTRNGVTCECEKGPAKCPPCHETIVNAKTGKKYCKSPEPCPAGQTRNSTTCACEPNPQGKTPRSRCIWCKGTTPNAQSHVSCTPCAYADGPSPQCPVGEVADVSFPGFTWECPFPIDAPPTVSSTQQGVTDPEDPGLRAKLKLTERGSVAVGIASPPPSPSIPPGGGGTGPVTPPTPTNLPPGGGSWNQTPDIEQDHGSNPPPGKGSWGKTPNIEQDHGPTSGKPGPAGPSSLKISPMKGFVVSPGKDPDKVYL